MNEYELAVKVHNSMYHQCQSRGYATTVDVLMDLGVLKEEHYKSWRYGRVPYLESESSERTGKQVIGISFSVPDELVGASPKPQTARFRVQSNTPDGVAVSLPSVAHSRTSAREEQGAIPRWSRSVTARFLFARHRQR